MLEDGVKVAVLRAGQGDSPYTDEGDKSTQPASTPVKNTSQLAFPKDQVLETQMSEMSIVTLLYLKKFRLWHERLRKDCRLLKLPE